MFSRLSTSVSTRGNVFLRAFSASTVASGKALRYRENGAPEKVLSMDEVATSDAKAGEVYVKFKSAPINPADINMIQGVYGIQPSLPAVGGNEGVAVVEEPGNSGLKKGDWVIPKNPGFGTWREDAVCKASELWKVPNDIPEEYAATLSVNPCTAYRMLNDFVELRAGDVVIQNGANSMVGQSVFQIAKSKGIRTINIVRDRDEQEYGALVERMKQYGADIVVPSSMVGTPRYQKLVSDLPKPKLALNCVGGQSATDLARALDNNGVMVTYGGMSKKPIQVPTSLFIFKNIQLKGFWMSNWIQQNSDVERQKMMDELADLIRNKHLRLWIETYPFSDYKNALQRALGEQRDRKIVLKF